jgi:aminoglycoside phosphotransferase
MEDFMIPEEKTAVVTRGLEEAFGVTGFEDIRMLTKGHTTSLVFRIVVKRSPYVLKIIRRTDSPARNYACMKAAAEARLAPRVWYANVEDRISITDYVEAVPFAAADALLRIPATLRRLHDLPAFPAIPDYLNTSCLFLLNKGPAVDGFTGKFREANLLPAAENEELFARYAQLAEVYPRDERDMVSSHNDLFKPDNLLFDGERLWMVDWEAAFRNDRYADLAVVSSLVATNEAEERAFLQAYFGQPPDEYQLARFYHMQQLVHLFYTMAFLYLGSAGKPIDTSEKVPEFGEFQRRMWAGEVDVADKQVKIVYGRSHWERLRRNTRQPRFEEAMRIVAGAAARR